MRYIGASIVIIAMLAIACNNSYAQAWEQVYPSWRVDPYTDVLCWHGDTVFISGYNFALMRSVNGGITWNNILSGDNRHISRMVKTQDELLLQIDRLTRNEYDSLFYPIIAVNPTTSSVRHILVPRTNRQPPYAYSNFYVDYVKPGIYVLERDDHNPALHRSTDEGRTWTTVPLPADAQVQSKSDKLFMVDSNLGFLIVRDTVNNFRRVLFKTTNQGASWHKTNITFPYSAGQTLSFSKVTEGNDLHCFLAIDSRIWKSVDFGNSWTETGQIPWNSHYHSTVADMDFRSIESGYVLGKESDIYKTTDAGITWTQIREAGLVDARGITTVSNNSILAIDHDTRIYRSDNEGITWATTHERDIRIIYYLSFTDLHNGTMVAANGNSDYAVLRTTNGGKSWKEEAILGVPYLGQLQQSTNGDIFLFTHESSSNNASLQKIATDPFVISAIKHWGKGQAPVGAFGPRGSVYTEYDNLHFLKSNEGVSFSCDNADTWSYYPYRNPNHSKSEIQFIAEDNGLRGYCISKYLNKSGGSRTAVYETLDTCKTWNEVWVSPDSTYQLHELDVHTQETLIIRGRTFTIDNGYRYFNLYSRDAGASWTMSNAAPPNLIETEYFGDTAYGLSGTMTIQKTEDMWHSSEIQLSWLGYNNVPQWYFLNKSTGWAYNNFVIYRTTNGGSTWTELPFTVRDDAAITAIYPNPVVAGQSTTIEIYVGTQRAVSLPHAMSVRVFDLLGRMVATLYNGPADPGTRTLTWQPSHTLPAGMYMVRMTLGNRVWAKQVAVVR